MSIVQTSAPLVEPVTVAECKAHMRLDADLTSDDTLIGLMIGAARRYAETFCASSFITQGWRQVLDAFPCVVTLERGPVTSVDAITYMDMAGTWQTVPGTAWTFDPTGPEPRITPVFGQVWPIARPQIASVRVDYTAGYGANATDVPEGIRHWLLIRVATLYENREEIAVTGRGMRVEPLPFVDGLLDPYRVVTA